MLSISDLLLLTSNHASHEGLTVGHLHHALQRIGAQHRHIAALSLRLLSASLDSPMRLKCLTGELLQASASVKAFSSEIKKPVATIACIALVCSRQKPDNMEQQQHLLTRKHHAKLSCGSRLTPAFLGGPADEWEALAAAVPPLTALLAAPVASSPAAPRQQEAGRGAEVQPHADALALQLDALHVLLLILPVPLPQVLPLCISRSCAAGHPFLPG